MARNITPPDEMNKLYDYWEETRDPALYDRLLQAVMDNAFNKYLREHGEYEADIIATLLASKVYRALPGYTGPSPLKPYDKSRGKFNAFQSTMARTTGLNYLRRRTANGSGERGLCYYGSEASFDKLAYKSYSES